MRKAVLLVALLLGVSMAAGAATLDPDRFIAQTQLDEDLIVLLLVDEPGRQVILAVVYVNERTLEGRHNPAVREVLPEYVDKNALLVTAYSGRTVDWDHTKVTVAQDDALVRAEGDRVVPITEGFTASRLGADKPIAGMLLLGDDIDPARSFTVSYSDGASAVMEVQFEQVVAEDDDGTMDTSGTEEPGTDGGEEAVGECVQPTNDECRRCPPLFGCLTECMDPCSSRGALGSILPLILLLLLGP